MEPLNLLREFTSAKRPITLKDDNLVFDKTAFARKTLTAYRSGLTGTGEFYPLDSLWFLLQQATARASHRRGTAKSKTRCSTRVRLNTLLVLVRG